VGTDGGVWYATLRCIQPDVSDPPRCDDVGDAFLILLDIIIYIKVPLDQIFKEQDCSASPRIPSLPDLCRH
jgi:hypothetical protein